MKALSGHPLLAEAVKLSHNFPGTGAICLVGGAVRDALLGHPVTDFDLTSPHDPTPLARALAKEVNGHWFWLDESRRQSRVVVSACSFDFAPWRAETFDRDLSARDYTINAMALDVSSPLTSDHLIDPLGGRFDLSAGILRCAGPGVLEDDPLRILKGVRHAVELGLKIEPSTLKSMQRSAVKLTGTAPERIRHEFWRILDSPDAARGIDLVAESGAGGVLIGADFCSDIDRIRSCLQQANMILGRLSAMIRPVSGWLSESIEQGLDRGGLLRWQCVFAASNREHPLRLARRWRFSRAAQIRIAALRNVNQQSLDELLAVPCRPRAIALWALRLGPDPIDLLLAAGLIQHDAPDKVCRRLAPILQAVVELPDPRKISPLVDSRWLMDTLGVEGADLGAIHAALRRAEIAGTVDGLVGARQFVLRHFPKNS